MIRSPWRTAGKIAFVIALVGVFGFTLVSLITDLTVNIDSSGAYKLIKSVYD